MTFSDKIGSFLRDIGATPEANLRRLQDRIFTIVDEEREKSNEHLRALFGTTYYVDEMALYFGDRDLLFVFVSMAVQRGWQLFNYAEDEVRTSPIRSNYAVEYWFMSHPAKPYRLELMVVGDGISPLHAAVHYNMSGPLSPCALVHASFKVEDEAAYGSVVVAMRAAGYEVAQHCTSGYGRFSYFVDPSGSNTQVALKPRLNVRDASNV